MRNEPSVCIIGTYFGSFPSWINVWLTSVKNNPTVDFLVITDQKDFRHPEIPNLYVKNMSLDEFKTHIQKKVGFKVKLSKPYKVCDYKPIYGLTLEEYIRKYDYWGECDFDLVFGDLRKFFREYHLERYDKFLNRGHLTLYRNTPEVNNRYKLSGGKMGSYKEVFKSNLNWAFDETMGIDEIYKTHNFSYFDKFIYADINPNYKDIRMVERPGKLCKNSDQQIFYYANGRVLRDYVKNGQIKTDELMYIHLQKRKMLPPHFNPMNNSFYILNGRFLKKESPTTLNIIEKYNKKDPISMGIHETKYKKDAKFYWLGRRWLNVRFNTINLLKNYLNK